MFNKVLTYLSVREQENINRKPTVKTLGQATPCNVKWNLIHLAYR